MNGPRRAATGRTATPQTTPCTTEPPDERAHGTYATLKPAPHQQHRQGEMTMGMHPKGKLFYGYDVGGGESDWKFAEAQESDTNPYGYLKTPWYDPEGDDDGESVSELINKVLYDAIPDAPEVEYDWQRDDPVKEHYGVWLDSHAHCDYPSYVLVTHEITAYQGDADLIDLTELAAMPIREDWDAKLARALEVLQVTPLQERPGWLLATDWG